MSSDPIHTSRPILPSCVQLTRCDNMKDFHIYSNCTLLWVSDILQMHRPTIT
ncbi:hypothetical protein C6P46_002063 [Rhodotorula mucilaginosa]|uniref:Uncharacterized protein n=1 Tax=Rhodotorula mucilaginosa TaxID=5537 RepID=A0A9P6VU58_RHOMI|nr:hypothetical protein C6P46_002063 [Rhodotorula mucilaginosa]TKA51086.1 hypothetical protein B0A53_05872 [Rhodotorula sp. CCFEE 5036]